MVGVAQLVEHLVVVQVVAGSSPVTHPISTTAPGDRAGAVRLRGAAARVGRDVPGRHTGGAVYTSMWTTSRNRPRGRHTDRAVYSSTRMTSRNRPRGRHTDRALYTSTRMTSRNRPR